MKGWFIPTEALVSTNHSVASRCGDMERTAILPLFFFALFTYFHTLTSLPLVELSAVVRYSRNFDTDTVPLIPVGISRTPLVFTDGKLFTLLYLEVGRFLFNFLIF